MTTEKDKRIEDIAHHIATRIMKYCVKGTEQGYTFLFDDAQKVALEYLQSYGSQCKEEGYKERDWEMKEEAEFDEAMEAHITEQGWCCACQADLMTLETKIKEAKEEGRKE